MVRILVTGAAGGIGLMTVRTLVDEGNEVIAKDCDGAAIVTFAGMAWGTRVEGSVTDKVVCLQTAARPADRPGGSPQDVKA